MSEPNPVRPPCYGEILRLDVLLDIQADLAKLPDDLFFIVMHQSHELWFKVLLHELEGAREHLADNDVPRVVDRLVRVRGIEGLLAEHLDVLGTLSSASFEILRDRLGESSGFQSAQFREIEFLSGRKDSRYVKSAYFSHAERERLARRYREPSLSDVLQVFLAQRNIVDLSDALRRERNGELTGLVTAFLGHDQGFHEWRMRHVGVVERFLGTRPGTGGTSGLSYLRSTLDNRFYPALWEAMFATTESG